MKNIIKTCWNSNYCKIILATLFSTLTLPLIFNALSIATIWRVGILFLLVNLIVSAIFGTWIKHTKQPKWTFLILPLSFLLLILVRYPKHIYVYLFLLLYLLVEYLAFSVADSKK